MLPRSVHPVRSSFSKPQARPFRQTAVYTYGDVLAERRVSVSGVQCARAIVRNMHGGTCENVGTSCTVREQWNDAFRTSIPVFQSNRRRKKERIQEVVSISASHEIRFFYSRFFCKKRTRRFGIGVKNSEEIGE